MDKKLLGLGSALQMLYILQNKPQTQKVKDLTITIFEAIDERIKIKIEEKIVDEVISLK